MDKKRYNIGLVISDVMDPFSNRIARGAMCAAEQLDVNLTIFPAKYVDHDIKDVADAEFEYQYNALISWAAMGDFDYIIASVGTIAYNSDLDRKKEILNIFKKIPTLCICTNVSGYDNVQYDNKSGIEMAVDYLVRAGRKHICMMSGSNMNYECVERFTAYKDALIKNGVKYADSMVMNSEFTEFCVTEAEELLNRNPEADAVLCVNDMVATAMCKVIKNRGKKIGEDIAVIGFDDLPFAAKMDPPLATVSADASKLGICAVQRAVNSLNGILDNGSLLATTFIQRASCMYDKDLIQDKAIVFSGDVEEIVDNIIRYIHSDVTQTEQIKENRKFWYNVISYLKDSVIGGNSGEEDIAVVCRLLENYLDRALYRDETLLKIMDVVELVCEWLANKLNDDTKEATLNHIRKVASRKLLGGVIADLSEENDRSFQYAHNTNLVTREMLMVDKNIKKSYANVLSKLYCLGVKRSYLYLLDAPRLYRRGDSFPLDVNWQMKAYQDGEYTFAISEENQKIISKKLYYNFYMPMNERHTYIVVDLYSREYQYGMLLCELDSPEFFRSLEFVVYQLSAAVKIIGLLDMQEQMLGDLHMKNLALEQMSNRDELTGIYNRRGFYSAVSEMITKKENKGRILIVCYADMDNLKLVNDAFGHAEGDFSLKSLADCLQDVLGERGIVGRMGGDEFAAVIFKDLIGDKEEILRKKEEWIQRLNENVGKLYRIDMSLGTYECICDNSYDLKNAIDKADDLLYTVKVKKKQNRKKNKED